MAKKSVAPTGEQKPPSKIYVAAPTEEDRKSLQKYHALRSLVVAEVISFFSEKLPSESPELAQLKVLVGIGIQTSVNPLKGLERAIKASIGATSYDEFIHHLTEKFELFSEAVLKFGVSKDDLLQIALTRQFGLSAVQADEARIKIVEILHSPSGTTAPRMELPEAPPAYAYAPRMAGGIVKYLEDNWAPYIAAGVLSRPDLRRIDNKAEDALSNFIRYGGIVPDHLHVLTKTELLNREIERAGGEERLLRLASALMGRKQRGSTEPR